MEPRRAGNDPDGSTEEPRNEHSLVTQIKQSAEAGCAFVMDLQMSRVFSITIIDPVGGLYKDYRKWWDCC